MSRNIRIFYAHKAGDESIRLQQEAHALLTYLKERATAKGQTITGSLTFGSKDHEKRFDGDWDGWAQSVSTARDSLSGNTLYNLIVVPEYAGGYVGKSTATILQSALSVGTKCFLATYETQGDDVITLTVFTPISSITCEDGNDFKSGWKVE